MTQSHHPYSTYFVSKRQHLIFTSCIILRPLLEVMLKGRQITQKEISSIAGLQRRADSTESLDAHHSSQPQAKVIKSLAENFT